MSDNDDAFLRELRATFAIEAQEHLQLLVENLLDLESASDAERQLAFIETAFRGVHSLKGAARAVERSAIEALCQSLENVLAALKNRRVEFSAALADLLHAAIDALRQLLSPQAPDQPSKEVRALCTQLDSAVLRKPEALAAGIATAAPVAAAAPAAAPVEEHADTVRIAVAKLDTLLRQAEGLLTAKLSVEQRAFDIEEIVATVAALRKERAPAAQRSAPLLAHGERALAAHKTGELSDRRDALLQNLDEQLHRLVKAALQDRQVIGGRVDQLLEEIKKISMVPAAAALKIFPKLVRDLARASAKEVVLNFSGGDIEVDRRILEEMRDPLIHMVRNCIDHGIEKPAERVERGKPAIGTITLAIAQMEGGRVEILIGDDGAGIERQRVRDAAQRLGVALEEGDPRGAQGDGVALALIFQSGVSTSPLVTDISGRGLGLAIVREKIEKLGGSVDVTSRPGAGTQFRIVLPITLATYRGVQVRCGGRNFVFPTTRVEQVTTVSRGFIKTVENRESITLQGKVVAVVRLAQLLALPDSAESGDTVSLVVGLAADKRIAFLVDEVIDEQEVLVKNLGQQLRRVRNIAGATLLRNGAVALILNMSDLMKSATRAPALSARAATAPKDERRNILVVEDSITSRMLLKGILESVGYRVTVAVDGADALQKLRGGAFDLVVSDVDMPRMSGLDLTASIRADADLAQLPVVLVTTLASAADRERGAEVGANAYLVKSSFEQSNLLEIVRRLL